MKVKTPLSSIILVSLSAFLAALGQVLYKVAVIHVKNNMSMLILSPWLYLGFTLYGIALIFMVLGLRKGDLSTLFPLMAMSFVWVSVFSVILLKESFPMLRGFGVGFIVAALIILNMR